MHYPLERLFPKIFAKPSDLAAVDNLQSKGCTAIVVACHCFLVRDVRPLLLHAEGGPIHVQSRASITRICGIHISKSTPTRRMSGPRSVDVLSENIRPTKQA
jgi:hypothetical protein